MALSIQNLIDTKLQEQQDKPRERSGKFSPSSFGTCYRKQWFNRKGIPKTNPPDARTIRVFKCGDLFHDFVQGFLPKEQTEIEVSTDDIYGRADIVLPDEVIDIKSCHSYQFHYFTRSGYDIKTEKFTNIIQLMSYAYCLNKPQGRLVFVSKDDLCIAEYVFFTEHWKSQVEEEIDTLKKLWLDSNPPLAKPRAYITDKDQFKECRKYCNWRDYCVSLGHVIPAEEKKTKKNKEESDGRSETL